MNNHQIIYSNLEELSNSIYTLTKGEADITGWPVKSGENRIGKVAELLFEPEADTVRYAIIALDEGTTTVEDKKILIPIGLVDLDTAEKEILVPDFHHEQLEAMPRYIIGEVTPEMEDHIRTVIGSPAALKMEEETVEIDRENFYRHQHFDRNIFPLGRKDQ
ncbi:PRC-barrel domain-containing protein [Pedobacter miscanthi]|jgi:hypothetical protein|uniref:PRC-barrel domain-containing protein n=1 Tax=Pedobacter miscanthi TaxID=2259170 RepID=UPI00292E4776|nr:PRC-barrel domain-containing protein [Pedobacter miscanthi]